MWRTLRNHQFMAVLGLLTIIAAFLLVAPFLTGQEQRVILLKKQVLLRGAYQEFTNTGLIRSFRDVSLSSNTVAIGNTQYQCVVEFKHSGGTLAMTTNFAFIWLGPNGVSRILPVDDRSEYH
jgi:hypothetical protein